MVHFINKAVICSITILLFFSNSCSEVGNTKRTGNNQNSDMTDSFLTIPDSILKSAIVLPDTYLYSEINVRSNCGYEISPKGVELLLDSGLGIVFPKGYKCNHYDLINYYLPNIQVYLVGQWLIAENVKSYIIKCSSKKEQSISFYLINVKESILTDAMLLAYVNNTYDQYITSPVLSEKLFDKSIVVFTLDKSGNRANEVYYTFSEDGVVNQIK